MKMKRNLYSTGLAAIVLFLFILAPVAAASLTNPIGDTRVQEVGMSSSPAVMEYHGKLYCFHQGSNNKGELWYSTFDGTYWYRDTRISNVSLRGSPAVTKYNEKLYCFYQGSNNKRELWYSIFDGTDWVKDTHVQGVGMSSSPAVIEYNEKLYCFYQGDNDYKQLWYCSFDGTNWAKDKQVQRVGMSNSPAVIAYNGKLYCFHQGSNNKGELWYSIFDGTDWVKDTHVQGVGMSSSPAVIEYNGKLYCFHQGSGNNGKLWYSTFDGKTWGKDIQVQNVRMSESPALINYDNVLYCFYQRAGNNSELWYSTFDETIPILPVANFRSNVTEGYAPLTVNFTDLSTNATKWNWDFGDRTTNSDKQNPMHTYSEAGNYKVNLTVENVGIQSSKTSEINVSPTPSMNSSMSVTVSSEPGSVEPDDLSTITVTVTGTDGKGISGANVKLEKDIGKFDQELGATNSSGKFISNFSSSGTGKATIKAQVTKEGFKEASGETNVDVKDFPDEPNADDDGSFPIVPLAAILLFALVGIVIYTKRPKPAPEPEPIPPKLPVEKALDMKIEPESIPADGKSTAKVIIKLKDDKGNSIQSSDEKTVELSTTLGTITGPVKFLPGESTVSATITSGLEAGTAKVKASSGLLKGEGKVQFTELVPVETALYVQIEPESIPADGKSTAKVTVRIRDDKGNFVPSLKERTVELSITLGTVTNEVKIPSGAREGSAVITSGEIAGTATVIASSSPLKEATVQVNFVSR